MLHVPVGRVIVKKVPVPRAGRVEKISARAQDRRAVSRYGVRRGRAGIVRVAEPVRSKAGGVKAGKGAAKSAGTAVSTRAGKAARASAGKTQAAVASRAKTTGDARRRKAN
jgi:membrane-bound lytic murein transglycosylase D